MKTILDQYATFNAEKAPSYSNSVEVAKKSVQSIDVHADVSQYVSENKTGVTVPNDIDYVAYDAANPIQPSLEGSKPAPAPPTKNAKPASKIGKYHGPTSAKDPTAKVLLLVCEMAHFSLRSFFSFFIIFSFRNGDCLQAMPFSRLRNSNQN
jgi:hypothetical protein